MLKRLLQLIMPAHCPMCGKPPATGSPLCEKCIAGDGHAPLMRQFILKQLQSPTPFCCDAVSPYEGVLRKSIHQLKFQGKTVYAQGIGLLMTETSRRTGLRFDVVTFVPMHESSLRQRGYNQAQLLAKGISTGLDIPLLPLLCKTQSTAAQHTLNSASRRLNVRSVFKADDSCRGKQILLVDDIVTTGSTICECAASLYKAGALSVRGICAASSEYGV